MTTASSVCAPRSSLKTRVSSDAPDVPAEIIAAVVTKSGRAVAQMEDELGSTATSPELTQVPLGHIHCLRVDDPVAAVIMLPPDKSAQASHADAPDWSENWELGQKWHWVDAACGAKDPGSHDAHPSSSYRLQSHLEAHGIRRALVGLKGRRMTRARPLFQRKWGVGGEFEGVCLLKPFPCLVHCVWLVKAARRAREARIRVPPGRNVVVGV